MGGVCGVRAIVDQQRSTIHLIVKQFLWINIMIMLEWRGGDESWNVADRGVLQQYLRPVRGCINAGCAAGAAVATAGLGLLTFVLLLANSNRIVCGMSGSNRTPCCEQPRAVRRSDIMPRRHLFSYREPTNPVNISNEDFKMIKTFKNQISKECLRKVVKEFLNDSDN